MGRYRKKPVVIDAVPVEEILRAYEPSGNDLPDWVKVALEVSDDPEDKQNHIAVTEGAEAINVYTLEGVMVGQADDWLIRGVTGELYPCKPDIFEATYVTVSDAPNGWQGEPPAEGSRRRRILEALKGWLLENPGKPVTSEEEAIDFADAIETALQSADDQPEVP